jgi:ABC-2 type transport system permease protein
VIALARDFPVYLQIAAVMPKISLAYRLNVSLEAVALLLQIFLLKVVWTAVYGDQEAAQPIPLEELVAYLTIANLQVWLLFPELTWVITQRVREGQIALDIARPVSFLGQMLAQQVGMTAGFATYVIAAFPFAFFLGALRPPASLEAAALYLLSLVLAFSIVALMGLLLGLVSIWTLETSGILAIYRFANMFFAGALVPLTFFPPLLRAVAEALPFQTQAFIPLSIYFGRFEGIDLARAFAVQIFWLVALSACVAAMWRSAKQKLVVQGG